MFFPSTLLSLTNTYLAIKHGTDPVSETLKAASLVFWEDKMTQLYFGGKTKRINSWEKSTNFGFNTYLGKNSSAPSPLCNKWNTNRTGRLCSSHIACTDLASSLGRPNI